MIGAGKSGTTTIHRVLQQHPRVYVTEPKEPGYFSDPRFSIDSGTFSKADYLALFRGARDDQVRGDFSTSYFLCPEAPLRIRDCNPAARFIVVLRDPVARAYSDYLMQRRRERTLQRDFVTEIRDEIRRLDEGRVESPFLVKTGLYYRNLSNYLAVFPDDRFLILPMTALVASPRAFYAAICEFLGIEPLTRTAPELRRRSNAYVELRSPLAKKLLVGSLLSRAVRKLLPDGAARQLKGIGRCLLYREGAKPEMPETAWSVLKPIFEDDLRKLEYRLDFDTAELTQGWPGPDPSPIRA